MPPKRPLRRTRAFLPYYLSRWFVALACMAWFAVERAARAGDAAEGAAFPPVEALPVCPEPPDPLIMFGSNEPVRTAEDWYQKRRPQIVALVQHYMYGYLPEPPAVSANVRRVNPRFLDGKATLREVTLTFGPPGTPPMDLLLIVPNGRSAPAPVFLGLNFCGNHTVVDDPQVALPRSWVPERCRGASENRASEEGRGSQTEVWCVDELIVRGYALATCYCGDIDPDKPDFSDGVHPHFRPAGQNEPGPHEWGTIAAWAWGLHRAVDYLVTCDDLDREKICVVGHSRLGKTALLAGALDERIALVVPHQSGTGGMALSRNNRQETVERINTAFPHWFNDTFTEFNGREELLPIDQHLLVCLVAPRPLLDTEGDQDLWANYDNALESLRGADAVYKLLGRRGLVGSGVVRDDEPFDAASCGELVQYRRDAPHVLDRKFWRRILDFADYQLGLPSSAP